MFVKEHIYGLCGLVKIFYNKIHISIWQWAKSPPESNMERGEGLRK